MKLHNAKVTVSEDNKTLYVTMSENIVAPIVKVIVESRNQMKVFYEKDEDDGK